MQFSAAAFLALAASVAAQDPVFEITNFAADCIPHSLNCVYDFDVFQSGTYQTEPQHCNAQKQSDDGSLPEVLDGTCEATSKTWTITRPGDGSLILTVSQQVTPASNETGSHPILLSEMDASSGYQTYIGPANFDLFYNV